MTDTRDSFVNVKSVIVADAPDAHQVWLDVGCQHFTVGEYCETKDEAEWLASQLRIALANTASPSSRGEAIHQVMTEDGDWSDINNPHFTNPLNIKTRTVYTAPGVVAGEVDEVLAAFSAATVTPDNRMYFNSGQDTTRMRKAIAALTAAIEAVN